MSATRRALPAGRRARRCAAALLLLALGGADRASAGAPPAAPPGGGDPTGTAPRAAATTGGAPAPVPAPSVKAPSVTAPSVTSPSVRALWVVAQTDKAVWTAVAVAADRRMFVLLQRPGAAAGLSGLALLSADGSLAAYPGGAWNQAEAAGRGDPAARLVGPTALRLAADGSLWVADSGASAFGHPPLPGAAKLVRIDLKTDRVTRTYPLPAGLLTPSSLIGDLQLHDGRAYVGDAGSPGLIVVDLATGAARRLLDHAMSTSALRPLSVSGETPRGADGKPVTLDAGPLAVSPDGGWLYFQPPAGPLYRVPTALLDDPRASPEAVAAAVEFWYDTPSLGGLVAAPDGSLLLDDVADDSVLRLSRQRTLTTLVRDPRLHGATGPALAAGTLFLPVAQFDRAGVFHHGRPRFHLPVQLLALPLPQPATPAPR